MMPPTWGTCRPCGACCRRRATAGGPRCRLGSALSGLRSRCRGQGAKEPKEQVRLVAHGWVVRAGLSSSPPLSFDLYVLWWFLASLGVGLLDGTEVAPSPSSVAGDPRPLKSSRGSILSCALKSGFLVLGSSRGPNLLVDRT